MTPFAQNCGGASAVILAVGATWSMISGAVVRGSVAGANFSVNEKLQRVDRIARELNESAEQLKLEPGVSPLKIQAIETELQQVETEIEATEQEIDRNLKQLVERADIE